MDRNRQPSGVASGKTVAESPQPPHVLITCAKAFARREVLVRAERSGKSVFVPRASHLADGRFRCIVGNPVSRRSFGCAARAHHQRELRDAWSKQWEEVKTGAVDGSAAHTGWSFGLAQLFL